MQFETVRKPLETIRDQVQNLGTSWAKEGRYLGAAALRQSAQTLAATAERLDGLAAKIEPVEPAPSKVEAEADAALIGSVAQESVADAGAPHAEASSVEASSVDASTDATPEASEGEVEAVEASKVPAASPSERGQARRRARR